MVGFVRMRRTQITCREQFIFIMDLFVIFPFFSLWGLKTPAICLFYTGFSKGDEDVEAWGWVIQTYARDFVLCSILICFLIIYLLFIILTKRAKWLSGWPGVQQALGPGFDSQVHPKLYDIFSNIFSCSAFQ